MERPEQERDKMAALAEAAEVESAEKAKAERASQRKRFDADLIEASASGKPFRIEHVVGGPSLVHYLTSEEVADSKARTAAEVEARIKSAPTLEERVEAIEKRIAISA